MRRVILESPYAGPSPVVVARNVRYLRACLRDCLLRKEAPFASHAIYTLDGVLDDAIAEERALGMEAGKAWLRCLDVHDVVVYTDLGVSLGMHAGIDNAKSWGRNIETRQLGGVWLRCCCQRPAPVHEQCCPLWRAP